MKMPTRATALPVAAAVLAVLTTTTLAAVPADAAVRGYNDPAGDGADRGHHHGSHRWGDIGRVVVRNAPHEVTVTVQPAPHGKLADYYDIYLDTDRSDPGPEVLIGTARTTEAYSVLSTGWFGDLSGRMPCAGLADWRFGRSEVAVSVPRRCVTRAAKERVRRVRVSVHSSMAHRTADWAPHRHRFGPWVAR